MPGLSIFTKDLFTFRATSKRQVRFRPESQKNRTSDRAPISNSFSPPIYGIQVSLA
jgi:hypothetical protein